MFVKGNPVWYRSKIVIGFQWLLCYAEIDFNMEIEIFWTTLGLIYFVAYCALEQEHNEHKQHHLRQAFIFNQVQPHHTKWLKCM